MGMSFVLQVFGHKPVLDKFKFCPDDGNRWKGKGSLKGVIYVEVLVPVIHHKPVRDLQRYKTKDF